MNTDTRSWGGQGTGARNGNTSQAPAANPWGARGPSIVGGGHHFTPAPAPAQAPVTGGSSWANQSASQESQSKGNAAGSSSWANANANPASGGATTSTGNGWVNAGNAAQSGTGSAGGGASTETGTGGGNDWVNAGNGSQNGAGTEAGASTGAGTGGSTEDSAGTGSGNGSEWVDAGNGGASTETGAGSTGENGQVEDTATEDTSSGGADNGTEAGDNAETGDTETGSGENGDGTGSGESGDGAGTDTDSGEAGSGSDADPAPVELDSAQQLDNIQFLQGLVGNESPSEADMNRVVGIYNSFRLSPEEMTRLQTLAQQTTARMFATEGQDFAAHAQNWSNLSEEERQNVVTAFFQGMIQDMDLETTLSFYNTPPSAQGEVSHGQYEPGTDVLSVNINSEAHDTLPKVMTTVFHELVHAYYFKQTEHISTSEIPALVEAGEMTYAQALTHLNAFPPLYLSEEDHGLVNYTLNPHEQLAFTGQYLFDQAIIDAGYEHERVIANDNPLFTHMQQHGFA
ncbi:MAG: hypothetical protein ACXIVD_09875 [Salinarimonas sp.]